MTGKNPIGRSQWTRRDAIRIGAAGAVTGIAGVLAENLVPAGVWARTQVEGTAPSIPPELADWKTEFKGLADGVYAYIQAGGYESSHTSVSNAGCIAGPDGLMSIDSLAAPLHTKAFMASARTATGKSFNRVLNTHHHLDNSAGNTFLYPAEIVASDFCRQTLIKALGSAKPDVWKKRDGWADGTEEWKVVPPSVSFSEKATYHFGNLRAECIFVGPAHTWGDVIVYLPQQKIVFAGDVAFHYITPTAWQGHISKWIAAVDMILAMDVETIVPGHGPIGTKRDLAQMRKYFALLKAESKKRHDAGMSAGKAAASIDTGKFENWVDANRIVVNVQRLYAEFDGTISPANDPAGTQKATAEINAIKGKRSS